jgi:hypothetical protein
MNMRLRVAHLLLAGAVFASVLVAKGGDLRTNQVLIGGQKVESAVADGKIGGEKWLAVSNGFVLIHAEVAPLERPVGAAATNAASKQYEPRLRLMLGEGHGLTKSGGVEGMHGVMYMARDWRMPVLARTNEVDILATTDKAIIVVMVCENGPLYSSTNSGMSWSVINSPGKYDFPLTSGPGGEGLYAETTINPSPENQKAAAAPARNWYAVGFREKGRELVMAADASQPLPTLSISRARNQVVVSWAAALSGFVLQENNDLSSTNWLNVTNPVEMAQDENQVSILSAAAVNNFYRLKCK